MIIVQYDDQTRPIYRQCIDQVKSKMPSGVTHQLITHCGHELRNRDYRCASEIVRLTEATVNPDMFWMDTDCLVNKWFDFEFKPGRPYMATRDHEAVFYVNGCTDFFKMLLKEYEDSKISQHCWLKKLFLNHKSDFEMLPEGYIIHIALSRAILAREHFNQGGNKYYRLLRDKLTGELKLELRI